MPLSFGGTGKRSQSMQMSPVMRIVGLGSLFDVPDIAISWLVI